MRLVQDLLATLHIIIWTFNQVLLALYHFPSLVFGYEKNTGIRHQKANVDPKRTRKLSKPLNDIRAAYDVVVIGSGYGGGVAASRMARCEPKQTVCVLERGLERWPGEYPVGWWQILKDVRLTGIIELPFLRRIAVKIGRETGLYRWVLAGSSCSVYVGQGLGGTSLLNANAFVPADPRVLQSTTWPEELRRPGALGKYYRLAEDMLEPTKCPSDDISKLEALRKQAGAVGLSDMFSKVPLTTSFTDRKTSAGVRVRASTLNGDDCFGQNDGSKLSTLVTYLADAWCHDAEMFCGTKVEYIVQAPSGGYTVYFRDVSSSSHELSWVHAKRFVFLGAGPIGSPEILFRSKKHGLPMSDKVGDRLSTNGCLLAFGQDLDLTTNPLASHRESKSPPGPTISGCIDCRDTKSPSDGFLIQEGAMPKIAGDFFRWTNWTYNRISDKRSWFRWLTAKWLPSSRLQHTQVYFGIGRDKANGTIRLEGDHLRLNLQNTTIEGNRHRLLNTLAAMTNAFHGVLKTPPVTALVHLLGGACYASDGTSETGCLAHTGELLTGEGAQVHEGLTVVDSSAIPTSLAANPLATITALAERSVSLVAAKAGLSIQYTTRTDFERQWRREVVGDAPESGIAFHETMVGNLAVGPLSSPASLDLDVLVTKSEDGALRQGSINGTLRCPALSKDVVVIRNGTFQLFEEDTSVTGQSKMSYSMTAITSAGDELHVEAHKILEPEVCFSIRRLWAASTTLRTWIRRRDGSMLASGTLTLTLRNLARLLRTLHPTDQAKSSGHRLQLAFLSTFIKTLLHPFLLPLTPLQFASDATSTLSAVPPHPPPSQIHPITASDNTPLTLRMYEPPSEDPHNPPPPRGDILFVPGAAVSYEIFAMPTVKNNAMVFFTTAGYRCWILEHRLCTTADGEKKKKEKAWTHYDFRLDIAAAVREVSRRCGQRKPYLVVHCVAALACAAGLLDGTIAAHEIAGLTASNVFLHPVLMPVNYFKARIPLQGLYRAVLGEYYPISISRHASSLVQRILTQALRFYPQSHRRELCTSATCLRSHLPFGRIWSHRNLSTADHEYIHRVMGGVHMRCLQLLTGMGLQGEVTDDHGRSLVSEANLKRLRGLRVFLFSNEETDVYSVEATARSAEVLKRVCGEGWGRRRVFEGFGHVDCWISGRAAERGRVYEGVLEEVEEAMAVGLQ